MGSIKDLVRNPDLLRKCKVVVWLVRNSGISKTDGWSLPPLPAAGATLMEQPQRQAQSEPLLSTRARRLGQVIRFARDIRAEESRHEMSPTVFGRGSRLARHVMKERE